MLILTFFLKVINNETKILTYHEIIDFIAEQIVRDRDCRFIRIYGGQMSYSFKLDYFCTADI